MPRRLVQIVTGLPPQVDGVGDYALGIARELRSNEDVDSTFLIANPKWQGPNQVQGFAALAVAQRTRHAFYSGMEELLSSCEATPSTALLLHCSMYGLAKRALPFWLAAGIEKWKAVFSDCTVMTMFHELDATGPFWKSAFWLSPVQQWLLKRFAAQSTAVFVSNDGYLRNLSSMAGLSVDEIEKLPVASNVGEPALTSMKRVSSRTRQLAIFGLRHTRDAIFEDPLRLAKLCRELAIERIVDIGPMAIQRSVPGTPVHSLGELDGSDVSAIFSESMFGLTLMEPTRLAKSGVFAALCAHGICPIVMGKGSGSFDGLVEGVHYFHADRLKSCDGERLCRMSKAVHAWYGEHTLAIQARRYAAVAYGAVRPTLA